MIKNLFLIFILINSCAINQKHDLSELFEHKTVLNNNQNIQKVNHFFEKFNLNEITYIGAEDSIRLEYSHISDSIITGFFSNKEILFIYDILMKKVHIIKVRENRGNISFHNIRVYDFNGCLKLNFNPFPIFGSKWMLFDVYRENKGIEETSISYAKNFIFIENISLNDYLKMITDVIYITDNSDMKWEKKENKQAFYLKKRF